MKAKRSLRGRTDRQARVSGLLGMVLFLGVVTVFSTGTSAADPARTIRRQCPIQRVETETEYQQAVLAGPEWKGGKVWVIGECTFDSRAIKSWAEAQGIKCRIASTVAYVGRRKIANGHWTVIPEGDRYMIDYVANIGLASRRIRKEDEFVFLKEGKNDHLMTASTSVVKLTGKRSPVRSIDFSVMPAEVM